ncbi:MAG: hypothetical protein RR726_27500 [Pseudomonas sp.]
MKYSRHNALLQTHTPRCDIPFINASVDLSYGEQGYACLLKQNANSTGQCLDILKSQTRADRYYASAYRSNDAIFRFDSGIWLLNGNGERDHAFTVDFRSHISEDADFTPHRLIEDAAGKLLCLGSVSTGHDWLWKFNADGTPDTAFGSAGHIDSDELLPEHLSLRCVAPLAEGYVLACHTPADDTVLVALANDGKLDTRFGSAGVLELEPVLAGYTMDITGLVATRHTDGSDCILLLSTRREDAGMFSVLSCITGTGMIDSSFGNQGHFRSEPGACYHGISVGALPSSTLWGGRVFEDHIIQPEITRLTSRGVPHDAFNEGKPVRFDVASGMWHRFIEAGDCLVGIGSFATHNHAVRYHENGTLDTSFVPYLSSGRSTVTPPNHGFCLAGNASIALTANGQRMLVGGAMKEAQQSRGAPVVCALSLC